MIRSIYPFFVFVALALQSAKAEDPAPWTQPREFSMFQFLLDRSPFSLPTVEESSPLADRFSVSGAATLDGEEMVFVIDRTDQTRYMVTKEPNERNMSLIEYLPDPDPRKMKATIRVDGQIATIAYTEPVGVNPAQFDQGAPGVAPPQAMMRQPNANVPPNANPTASAVQLQNNPNEPPRVRRVIRRPRGISGQPIPGP